MQTFLPDPNYSTSAAFLDKRRCWKQVLEARQILASLGVTVLKKDGTPYKKTHPNHPIYKMWHKNISSLMVYHDALMNKTLLNGTKTAPFYFFKNWFELLDQNTPDWLGNKNFHDSHKSNLLRKDFEFYSGYNWDISSDLEYVWPNGNDDISYLDA